MIIYLDFVIVEILFKSDLLSFWSESDWANRAEKWQWQAPMENTLISSDKLKSCLNPYFSHNFNISSCFFFFTNAGKMAPSLNKDPPREISLPAKFYFLLILHTSFVFFMQMKRQKSSWPYLIYEIICKRLQTWYSYSKESRNFNFTLFQVPFCSQFQDRYDSVPGLPQRLPTCSLWRPTNWKGEHSGNKSWHIA